jgi:hypothetical protein
MQWIQARKPEYEKFAAADLSVAYQIAVPPKKDEAADAPEYAYPLKAMDVKQR